MAKFKKGQSGNPAGKPKGAKHKITLAMEALLDGEAETITRKAIQKAKAGEDAALRLVLERILPPRKDRPVKFELPKLEKACDSVKAAAAIAEAVALGELTPLEAAEMSNLVNTYIRAIEVTEHEERLKKLEMATQ
jgi:hypothetical protein